MMMRFAAISLLSFAAVGRAVPSGSLIGMVSDEFVNATTWAPQTVVGLSSSSSDDSGSTPSSPVSSARHEVYQREEERLKDVKR